MGWREYTDCTQDTNEHALLYIRPVPTVQGKRRSKRYTTDSHLFPGVVSWFEQLCQKFDTEIIVVNNETLSPEEELVSDIVSILHVFSCRLYGLRKYKKIIREDEDIVKML